MPGQNLGWPPFKPSAVWVPAGKKASLCFRCGHVRLIELGDDHKDCGMCGAKVDFVVDIPAAASSGPS